MVLQILLLCAAVALPTSLGDVKFMFEDRNKLQGYVCYRPTSSLRKFYGRYGELVMHYDAPSSRMVNDILDHSPNKVIHVDSAHLSPYPVIVPGDITGDIVIQAPRYVNGDYKLQLTIHKKALFWIKVPCVSGVGSCQYDLCPLLARNFIHNNQTECPLQLVAQNLPCTCPFQPGTYTLKPATFTVPKLDSLWSWLASGDYQVDAKLIEGSTGEEVANYHVELTAHQPPCKGFLCSIFG